MRRGIAAEGSPAEVVTEGNIRAAYGAGSRVYSIDGLPAVLPAPFSEIEGAGLKLILVRHGETTGNSSAALLGRHRPGAE